MNLRIAMSFARILPCISATAFYELASEAKSAEPDRAPTPAANAMIGKRPGQERDDNGLKMKLVWCPAGQFRMGSPESEANRKTNEDQVDILTKGLRHSNEAQVEVILTKGYWLGKYEITQSQWKQVMESEPWKGKGQTKEGDDCPATFVSWNDAMEFDRKFTERERAAGRLPAGWEYTLPTEAQWERACRAGTETKFSFGDDDSKLTNYAWFADNTFGADEQYAHSVGEKKPNAWGLHDMHGNVMELCRDWYQAKLPGGRDPEVTQMSTSRVIRGGSWSFLVNGCRSARRISFDPSYRDAVIGFRVRLGPSSPSGQ
jgi:formylglycine-generating enzyme required for sulfatase activity